MKEKYGKILFGLCVIIAILVSGYSIVWAIMTVSKIQGALTMIESLAILILFIAFIALSLIPRFMW